jgi:hypothetical protein
VSFNAYWYVGLALLSLILLGFVFLKKRNNIHIFFQFLLLIEIAYLIEAVIYIFLGSYLYHPKVIHYNAYYDSHLGALTSNLITVPAVATFISVFQLSWRWIILSAALLAGIEWLFVKLQIYTLHWWRIEYTALGLLAYFPLAKVIYRRLSHSLSGFIHSVFLFLCIAPFSGTFHVVPIMFFSNRVYLPGWYDNQSYDTSAFAMVYYISICVFLVVLVKMIRKHRWLKHLITLMFTISVTIILKKLGILYSTVWWDSWFYILFPLILLMITEAFSKRLYGNQLVN